MSGKTPIALHFMQNDFVFAFDFDKQKYFVHLSVVFHSRFRQYSSLYIFIRISSIICLAKNDINVPFITTNLKLN